MICKHCIDWMKKVKRSIICERINNKASEVSQNIVIGIVATSKTLAFLCTRLGN